MTNIDLLKQQEVVATIFRQALIKDQLSHAYLFNGVKGNFKFELAKLIAQSIICEGGVFGCNECEVCKRVSSNNYADLIIIDQKLESIKKEQILNIQSQFSKTAIEAKGKKIFIINNLEMASVEAQNTLLKFLEEPSDDVVAFLITDDLDKILPTIISRCQLIEFKPLAIDYLYRQSYEKTPTELDAFMLSHLVASVEDIIELSEEEAYQIAIKAFEETLSSFSRKHFDNVLYIQKLLSKKGKQEREVISLYLKLLRVFFKYKLQGSQTLNEQFNTYLNKLELNDMQVMNYLLITIESLDKINRSTNISLLMDSYFYQLWEVDKHD